MNTKKLMLVCSLTMIGQSLFSQQAATGISAASTEWHRGGNTNAGAGGTNNIFGTFWQSPIYHYTNSQPRMAIFDDTPNNSLVFNGGVGINYNPASPITTPGALLHLGNDFGVNTGWRQWMEVGTLYNFNSDNMYVGLKDEGGNTDRQDAVIAWGDNTTFGGPAFGADYMRFIFTAPQGDPNYDPIAAGNDGLEVMRMNWQGRVGIGNYFNSVLWPIRDPSSRLEILSDKTAANLNGSPQVRITHTQQTTANPTTTGKFTDFETTTSGDLIITPKDNTQAVAANKTRFVGIHTNTPGNTLEINSNAANAAGAGSSGLRFTDLRYGTSVPTAPLANQGVLSVDANGNVVYITAPTSTANITANNGATMFPAATNVQWGQANTCAGLFNGGQLVHDTEIPTNGFNTIFYGFGTAGVDRVAFGRCIPGTISTKHYVYNNIEKVSSVVENDAATIPILTTVNIGGIASRVFGINDITTQASAIGVQGTANNTLVKENVGTKGTALNNMTVNYGVKGEAGLTTGTSSGVFTGVFGESVTNTGATNYGGFFQATGGSSNYGIYASAGGFASTPSGPNTSVQFTNDAGYFDGDVIITGQYGTPSDARLKKDILEIRNPLEIIAQLNPVTYNYDVKNHPNIVLSNKKQYGFIAQEVEKVLPELTMDIAVPEQRDSIGKVVHESEELLGVNYVGFIAILTEAIQKQQEQINMLTQKLDELTNSHQQGNNQDPINNQIDVTLSDNHTVVLNQNMPNPFAENTTITYNIPVESGFAQMIFYNKLGQMIKIVDINEKGEGRLNVFANDLSNGTYTYSLVIDGKVFDTKKMIVTK